MRFIPNILLFSACIWLTACSTQEVYTGESFASDSPFKMRVEGGVAPACESARRSLLGQGYLIESASDEGIKARKATRGGETQNTFIEMNVVCLPDSRGSTLFATGVLTTYELKKSSSAASVGLAAVGSISLPIGQSADSLVKVSEQTIDDKDFYGRFFAAVSSNLKEMEAGKAPPEPAVEPAAPEPAAPGPAPEPTAVVPPASGVPAAPGQAAQPGVSSPGVASPGAATPPPAQPAPVTPAMPAAVQPVVATTPAPTANPASTVVAPENPDAPALTPTPVPVEPAPAYTLQPDPVLAPPAVTLDPPPGAEQAPAADVEPVANEEAPADAPQPAPQPEPTAPDATKAAPVGDNTLLFL